MARWWMAAIMLMGPGWVTSALANDFGTLLATLREDRVPWGIEAQIQLTGDPALEKPVRLRIDRPSVEAYRLTVEAAGHTVYLERSEAFVRLGVPSQKALFHGEGESGELAPVGLLERLVSTDSAAKPGLQLLLKMDPAMAEMALGLAGFNVRPAAEGGWALSGRQGSVQLRAIAPAPVAVAADEPVTPVERAELERLVARALHRAGEVLWPAATLDAPPPVERAVPHGRLTWIDGQRVVHLWGNPEQIGRAHGQLLADEARRCVDSTLYLVGLAHAVRQGTWLPDDLRGAWARLRPHIPQAHLREAEALAEAAGIDPQVMQLTQVFPELFHCSGFAVMDSATADGKLYHGRVLDYMTHIGLQHVNTVFVMQPEDRLAFVNVGYAGFIGSVTGMNDQQISLGEMGGAGLGDWDGVPMATLMRRALEECRTLDEVQQLWTESPRTCEYFYVWADGKTRQAVGVAATPEKIEFIHPGQTHPLLGEGIRDALLLSRGERLDALCERVEGQHGQIDVQAALGLMARPVAMKSNLHNVLFVPEDLELFVAHADSRRRAYDRPYVRMNLGELLAGRDMKP